MLRKIKSYVTAMSIVMASSLEDAFACSAFLCGFTCAVLPVSADDRAEDAPSLLDAVIERLLAAVRLLVGAARQPATVMASVAVLPMTSGTACGPVRRSELSNLVRKPTTRGPC